MYYTKEKSDLWHELQPKSFHLCHFQVRVSCKCNTYRPEWTDSEYWARLNHAIGLAYQVSENIVISGDLNSDLCFQCCCQDVFQLKQ
jgi:hypothetical protein